jgi:hypothetical protein
MSYFDRYRIFQKTAVLIFATFFGLMVFVTYVAMTRQSGKTGQDPAKIQQIRYNNEH